MPINDSSLEGMFTFETGAKPRPDDPPFHILVVGDFGGDAEKRSLADRHPVLVDRDNFNEVMGRLGTRLMLEPAGSGSGGIGIEFRDIDDFHPDNLFRSLPIFAELREIRRDLKSADRFEEAASRVRSWFSPQPDDEPVPEATANSVSADDDNLLDLVLSGPVGQTRDTSDLGRLVSALVEPHLIRVDEVEQARLVSALDSAIAGVMRSVLHDSRFRALEAIWTGLHFLIKRVETDVDLKIFVWDVSKDEAVEDLKAVSDLSASAWYRELVRETVDTPGGEPFAAIGACYDFGLDVEDVAALMRMGKLAEAAGAPLISMMRPELFGVSSFAAGIDREAFRALEETREAKLWEALRSSPESLYLCLVPTRFLGRVPYGAKSDPAESFEFEEFEGEVDRSELLWISPSFAVLVMLAQSFRSYGWDMGQSLRADLSGLPLFQYVKDGESTTVPCSEVVLTEQMNERLLESGLMPLVWIRDTDRIRAGRIQSIPHGGRKLAARWNR